jgi:N-carbamoyl-L-amino-acid hydrolase
MDSVQTMFDGELLLADLEALAQIGVDEATGGMLRQAYGAADRAGRAWVRGEMEKLGLAVTEDAAGNTIALYPGTEPDLPPIALGSHTDTVPYGGRYDGALGVLAALAALRTLQAAGVQLRHPVAIINFAAEEATMAGGTMGSRLMAGNYEVALLQRSGWNGRSLADILREAGLDPQRISEAERPVGSFAAYVELHVEQGGLLAETKTAVGVVSGIVGIRRYQVIFPGYANHAGTTPMASRRDALWLAAPYVLRVRDVAVAHGIVGTVGEVTVSPGVANVIPGRVELSVEIRGLETAVLDAAETELRLAAEAVGAAFDFVEEKEPVLADPRIMQAIAASCTTLELSHRVMPSGAGHDGMNLTQICPIGMIFVPSEGGISHSPDEYTAPQDNVNGGRVLLETLLRLDGVL